MKNKQLLVIFIITVVFLTHLNTDTIQKIFKIHQKENLRTYTNT